jgi:hypothetical protein
MTFYLVTKKAFWMLGRVMGECLIFGFGKAEAFSLKLAWTSFTLDKTFLIRG